MTDDSEARRIKEENLALILSLAARLGVKIEDGKLAIAVDEARIRAADGSLEATMVNFRNGADLRVESPRAPGIYIKLVDHQKAPLAPPGAIYEIYAYMPASNGNPNEAVRLNGDIANVYVGRDGLILSYTQRQRARELSLERPKNWD